MKFTFAHNNINVFNLEKSIEFYNKALGLTVAREKFAEDGSYKIVYLKDEVSDYRLELTWIASQKVPYNLGDNEIHIAFTADDYEAAHKYHSEMGCICYENNAMGIYFISDPDGYWLEVVPKR